MSVLSLIAGIALILHVVSSALVLWRLRSPAPRKAPKMRGSVTVLRPVCGLDPDLHETLATTFADRDGPDEVIFCVADADDPAIPLVQALMAENPGTPTRLLIGEDQISGNPKLNNVAKGWTAASHEWIAIIDSNVALPRNYVQTLFATWRDDTGLVTSPPVGVRPGNFWAALEAAFLNTYQGRLQLAADQLGAGFAQGKVLFWRRDILDAAGGLAALGNQLAEDVAATKVVRAAGLKVRVVPTAFPQPLGQRSAREVWQRQVRWAKVRRAGFPAIFATEIGSGTLPPVAALAPLIAAGTLPPVVLPAFLMVWYGTEWGLAWRMGWPCSARQVVAWVLRDALIPALWLTALAGGGIVWRGNAVTQRPASLAAGE